MRPAIGALVLAGLTLLAAGCATAGPGPDPTANAISVIGIGRANVPPDIAVLMLGVESLAPTLAEATADAARRMSAVLARIKASGVADADISTASYSVDPRLAPPDPARRDEPPRIVGYHVSNVAQVKVRKIPDAGPILDAAVTAGANTVRGIRFTLADPSAAQAEARKNAVADALAKTRQLAAAANVKLGDILSIRETGAAGPPPTPVRAMAMRAEATPIEPGQLEIVVMIELRQAIQR
jgi:uncharacterized protein YggE